MRTPADFDKPCSLLKRTKELLAKYRETNGTMSFYQIHMATGLGVHWLQKVSSGNTAQPSVCKVQHLYEHLTGKKLTLH